MSKPLLDKPIPLFSEDLIKELDQTLHSGVPTLGESPEIIWTNAALRNLITSLKLRLERQKTESVKGNITS